MVTETLEQGVNLEGFAALADPTRMAILTLLSQQDQCVCHFVEQLGLKQSVLSHHAGVLRRAGLISPYPHPNDRRWLYYRLNRGAVEELVGQLNGLLDPAGYDPNRALCGADEQDCC